MSKITLFSVFVLVFLGISCFPVKSKTTEPTLKDWKEMVELRLLNLERELDIQKKANAKLLAANRELRETCKRAKRRVQTYRKESEHVAFYSLISADTTRGLHPREILVFDNVKLNKGNGYHSHDGIFIVPVKGTYAFVWTLGVSKGGWISTNIAINGRKYGGALADGDTASVDFGTGFVIAEVNAGDHVYIRMEHEGHPILYGHGKTSFSGWKL